jgi:hypothetical protein
MKMAPTSQPHLVVTIDSMLICIQASWTGKARMVNKNEVHTLVFIMVVSNGVAHDILIDLREKKPHYQQLCKCTQSPEGVPMIS